VVQNADVLGQVFWSGADGTDIKSPAAAIQGLVDGTPGTNDMPGRLSFLTTADGTNTVTERMRIDNEGRVSIGYAGVKSSKLLVMTSDGQVPTNASAARPALNLTSSQTAAVDVGPSIYFRGQTGNTTAEYSFGAIQGVKGSATAADYGGHLVFYTQPAGGATLLEEGMRLKNGGYAVISSTGGVRQMSLGVTAPRLTIEGTSATAGRPGVAGVQNSNDTSGPVHYLAKTRGSANGSITIVQDDDYLGQLNWNGADGTQMVQAGNISLRVDGTPGVNDMPGRLVFMTTSDGANSPTERMRITNGGRVLIATTSTIESTAAAQVGSGSPGLTTLGTTVNDSVHAFSLVYDVTNNDALNFSVERFSSGSDWTTANQRIQRRVDSTDMGYIEFGSNASANIIFGEANTEYGRVDGSGHLNWGIVDAAPYDNTGSGGIALRQEGMIYNAAVEFTPIVTNRISDEGDIVQFRTDGVRRGAIAIFNSDPHIMANSDWGLKLYDQSGNHILHPTNTTGGSYSAQVNLGYSASQFKDGYFYGGLYINGVDSNSEGSTFWTIRRHNDGGGGGLFPTLFSGKAQMGELYAYDASNGNWCHYSLKKDDAAGGVQTQQISGTGLTIAATNSGGTIQMSNTSSDVDMVVTIYGVEA